MPDDGQPKGLVPVPDPSLLTTQQLLRELAALKDFVEARHPSTDRVIDLLHRFAAEARENTDIQAGNLREFFIAEVRRIEQVRDEKFAGIENRLHERDERFELRAKDAKEATAMALDCADKAAIKSESAFTKAIEQQQLVINAIKQNADDKIDSLKSRLDRGEGGSNSLYSMAAAMAALLALVISAYAAYHTAPNSIQPTVQYVPAPTAVPAPAPVTVPR